MTPKENLALVNKHVALPVFLHCATQGNKVFHSGSEQNNNAILNACCEQGLIVPALHMKEINNAFPTLKKITNECFEFINNKTANYSLEEKEEIIKEIVKKMDDNDSKNILLETLFVMGESNFKEIEDEYSKNNEFMKELSTKVLESAKDPANFESMNNQIDSIARNFIGRRIDTTLLSLVESDSAKQMEEQKEGLSEIKHTLFRVTLLNDIYNSKI